LSGVSPPAGIHSRHFDGGRAVADRIQGALKLAP
jgi:hypothetical protein